MKGILFKPDMHKSIQDNLKSVTRRLDGLKEINKEPDTWAVVRSISNPVVSDFYKPSCMSLPAISIKPRYQVGETVYIKEAHYRYGHWKEAGITKTGRIMFEFEPMIPYEKDVYFPDSLLDYPLFIRKGIDNGVGWYLRSPLFLPTWAARDFVKITDVRAERFQNLTEQEFLREGGWKCCEGICGEGTMAYGFGYGDKLLRGEFSLTYKDEYDKLWNAINPKYPCELNPWLWRYEFRRLTDA